MMLPKLYLTNTETHEKEIVRPHDNTIIRYYTCGPTVYDYAHIGNFRTFVFEDILKRTMLFLGMQVHHVMNLTDIDDKTIRGARAKQVPLDAFTKPYKQAFFDDIKALNILPADDYPEATKYIPQMIEMIETLLQKKIAYQGADKSIYYAVSTFPQYGKLSHLSLDSLETGASERVHLDEYSKEEARDFVLWKNHSPERDGDIFWQSPFGPGRPGWHIECSVMAKALLGDTIDIHAGGVDLIFPHHENEIAQSEACTGTCFAKLWVHAEHLLVDHKKMSKSLGNFYTLRDLAEKGYTPRALRFCFLQTHYRTPLNFTLQALASSEVSLKRLQDFIFRLENYKENASTDNVGVYLDEVLECFANALSDDLNTSEALACLFDMVRHINNLIDQGVLSQEDVKAVIATLKRMDTVLGCLDFQKSDIPQDIQELLHARKAAREARDWKQSDLLRATIMERGYAVEDSPQGQLIKKK